MCHASTQASLHVAAQAHEVSALQALLLAFFASLCFYEDLGRLKIRDEVFMEDRLFLSSSLVMRGKLCRRKQPLFLEDGFRMNTETIRTVFVVSPATSK